MFISSSLAVLKSLPWPCFQGLMGYSSWIVIIFYTKLAQRDLLVDF